jgi:prephenate dehydratase
LSVEIQGLRVAFQGEAGAFSEAAAVQLLGEQISTVPRPTFNATFSAISEGAADALLVPVENSLAGSVVRVYDLLLESELTIAAETILPIELNLIACRGASVREIHSVSSHPMALAQCERFFAEHPQLKRVPSEDTAGSVREVLARGDKAYAAIAGTRAAIRYCGVILAEKIQDNAENFTRFVLLVLSNTANQRLPIKMASDSAENQIMKMSVAMRLAHRPGSLLSSLEPFARHGVNLLKIESRPIHGRPWEYQFFIDVETGERTRLDRALSDLHKAAHEVRVLGVYQPARASTSSCSAPQSG